MNASPPSIELIVLWTAIVGTTISCVVTLFGVFFRKSPEKTILGLMLISWLLLTLAIGLRWARIGHLPVGNIFEMLAANVWGLLGAIVFGYWRLPRLRAFSALVLPIVVLVMGWMMLPPWKDSTLPSTYNTIWLFIHIAFIKLFLGCAVVALGIGGVILARRTAFGLDRFSRLPADITLDEVAYRCMALALIFDSLGIVAGAIWANDAWGRYWSWDNLEVWSLITWLSIGLTLHVRATFRISPTQHALMIGASFIIAFLTFFGVPFVSKTLHQGMI